MWGDHTVEAVIDDLSENGVCVLTYSLEPLRELRPEAPVTLSFETVTAETLNFHCKVEWLGKLPHGIGSKIGMKIIDPPWDQSKSFL